MPARAATTQAGRELKRAQDREHGSRGDVESGGTWCCDETRVLWGNGSTASNLGQTEHTGNHGNEGQEEEAHHAPPVPQDATAHRKWAPAWAAKYIPKPNTTCVIRLFRLLKKGLGVLEEAMPAPKAGWS